MPNHVTNRLTIRGDNQEALQAMADIMRNEDRETGLFHYLIPCPDDLHIDKVSYPDTEECRKERLAQLEKESFNAQTYGYPTWYEFNIDNWGTKWDAYSVGEVTLTEGELILSFDTAWSAPIPIFNHLVDMGFEVEAVWFEEGVQSWGSYHNGGYEEGTPSNWDEYDKVGPVKFYEDIIPPNILDSFPYLNEYIQDCQGYWEEEQEEDASA
jgi:hypothetical protein